jgi:hypothetical protein
MSIPFKLHFADRAYTGASDGGAHMFEWLCHAESDLNALGALAAQKAAVSARNRQARQVLLFADLVGFA